MKRAFCFDLDGTLTEEEILPEISRTLGIFEEIEILTKITMQGLMTFDKSLKLRVKLLSSIPISTVNQIVSKIRINRLLKDFINQNSDNCYIVTGNLDVWIHDFINENFGCKYFSSEAEFKEDQLLGLSKILHKSTAIEELRSQYDSIVAIGDGMNDCSMFEAADIGISFGGVHSPVPMLIQLSDYVCYDSGALIQLITSLNKVNEKN